MLTALLGLCTAITYGAADFFAAIASRKVRVVEVTALASGTGLVVLLILLPFMGGTFSQPAFFWGLMGGLSSVVALLSLYASLALGPISIISPLGALVSAIVPAIIGVSLLGESFSIIGWFAIALALVAVVLVGFVPVSATNGVNVSMPKPRAILLAIIAGAGIGLAVTSLARSPQDSGIAPIIVMRTTAALLLGLLVLFGAIRNRNKNTSSTKASTDGRSPLTSKVFLTIVAAGALDAGANIFFTLASRTGSLTVVGVLTALYPLGTILLARVVLKEHVATTQKIGIALTITASLLLALA
jgi:drug/metabolite transporter (DMT)-like permease